MKACLVSRLLSPEQCSSRSLAKDNETECYRTDEIHDSFACAVCPVHSLLMLPSDQVLQINGRQDATTKLNHNPIHNFIRSLYFAEYC